MFLVFLFQNSLDQLQKAIKGFVVMSEELEMVYNAFLNNQVSAVGGGREKGRGDRGRGDRGRGDRGRGDIERGERKRVGRRGERGIEREEGGERREGRGGEIEGREI